MKKINLLLAAMGLLHMSYAQTDCESYLSKEQYSEAYHCYKPYAEAQY
ncbi:hypothetical protein [Riemerella columbipharyngis]|uniref:Uncharacterized protein n=1 Tax=Riemerella columbipharyngis TaxID=1071918 RepID=A0A1G6YHS8_9FLAO|nr:hypothetical protein [Riemerella columbipharyngis]SDD89872.1 hypothetical protein SAMN05421544_101168 [Riemerella columbipharyngis]